MFRNRRIAVTVPAHNEARLIAGTLARIPGWVDVVIAVDDASNDATLDAIRSAAAAEGRITWLEHPQNRGVGAAIVSGYREALRRGAEVVAVMDGDGQMSPDDLAAVLEPVCSGRADFAKGSRFDGWRPRGRMPAARIAGNHLLSALTRFAAGTTHTFDAQCGYTAITAGALNRIPLDELYPRYGFPNDILMRVLEAGLSVESVPVRAVYGAEISGIRAHVAVPRILALLGRGMWRRLVPPRIIDVGSQPLEADEG